MKRGKMAALRGVAERALTLHCPTCNAQPGANCKTIRAQGEMGFQFPTTTHVPRLRAARGLLAIERAEREKQ